MEEPGGLQSTRVAESWSWLKWLSTYRSSVALSCYHHYHRGTHLGRFSPLRSFLCHHSEVFHVRKHGRGRLSLFWVACFIIKLFSVSWGISVLVNQQIAVLSPRTLFFFYPRDTVMWSPCQLPSAQRHLEMLKMNQPKNSSPIWWSDTLRNHVGVSESLATGVTDIQIPASGKGRSLAIY